MAKKEIATVLRSKRYFAAMLYFHNVWPENKNKIKLAKIVLNNDNFNDL